MQTGAGKKEGSRKAQKLAGQGFEPIPTNSLYCSGLRQYGKRRQCRNGSHFGITARFAENHCTLECITRRSQADDYNTGQTFPATENRENHLTMLCGRVQWGIR